MVVDRSVLFSSVLLVFAIAGCNQRSVDMRVDASKEVVRTLDASPKGANGPEMVREIGPATQVVTGEPATTSEDQKEDGTTAEDKTGAVAVKTTY